MKHLFTLSLVFFSLTHMAQAQRVDGLMMAEKYCNEELSKVASATAEVLKQNDNVQLLNAKDLSRLGILPAKKTVQPFGNPPRLYCIVTAAPRNNSP